MLNNIFIILIKIHHFLVDFIILKIEIVLLLFYIKIQIKILLKKILLYLERNKIELS